MFVKGRSDEERFLAMVSPEPNSGCWLWEGTVNSGGYGQFGMNRRAVKARKVSNP